MSTSSTPKSRCPLCNEPVEKGTTTAEWVTQFRCKRCGRFDLQLDGLAGIKQEQMYLLSAAIRNWTGAEVVTISQANVETLMEQAPKLGVSETLNQILELAAAEFEASKERALTFSNPFPRSKVSFSSLLFHRPPEPINI